MVVIKNLFHPAEYAYFLSEGFSCQMIVSEMKVNSGFVVFLCGSVLFAPTGNESGLHMCFPDRALPRRDYQEKPVQFCSIWHLTLLPWCLCLQKRKSHRLRWVSEFFQQIGKKNLYGL